MDSAHRVGGPQVNRALQLTLATFPVTPIGLRDAIGHAIRHKNQPFALTRWSDARPSEGASRLPADTRFVTGCSVERGISVVVDADRAFMPIAD